MKRRFHIDCLGKTEQKQRHVQDKNGVTNKFLIAQTQAIEPCRKSFQRSNGFGSWKGKFPACENLIFLTLFPRMVEIGSTFVKNLP